MTEQSHKKECDINQIMKKFQKTGVLDHVKKHGGEYADIPSQDYREAMEIITTADSMFEELPSEARAKFDNDPVKFLEYVQNEENKTALHEMGLLDPSYEPQKAENSEQTEGSKKGSKATSNSGGVSDAEGERKEA